MTGKQTTDLIETAGALVGEFNLSHHSTAAAVGAALRTVDGNIYTGVCMHLSCGIGFCAEHSAIAEMLKHRETRIETIVAVNRDGIVTPCGRCRELIVQVATENHNTRVIVDEQSSVPLSELLPMHWLDIKARQRQLKAS